MDYEFRPIESWPGDRTRRPERSRFRVSYSQTLDLLEDELERLGARHVVLQVYLTQNGIRLDGRIRSNARPDRPGVIVSFGSKHGPLSYPCDKFDWWQDNLRAIAKSLEALRMVDRYGVTKRSEQYRGWQKLPAPEDNGQMTVHAAAELIRFHAQFKQADDIRNSANVFDSALRYAEKNTHPDRGGNSDDFKKVQQARAVLLAYHRKT